MSALVLLLSTLTEKSTEVSLLVNTARMSSLGCHTQPWESKGKGSLISQVWVHSSLFCSRALSCSCQTVTCFLCWTASKAGESEQQSGPQKSPNTCSNCPMTLVSPNFTSPLMKYRAVRQTCLPSVHAIPCTGWMAWWRVLSPVLRSFALPRSILAGMRKPVKRERGKIWIRWLTLITKAWSEWVLHTSS